MANEEPGVIGRGVTIRGTVVGAEPLIVAGAIEGSVSLESHLTVEATGRLAANVEGVSVTVDGLVEGTIVADEVVAIRAGAKVVGDVTAPQVVIEEGAFFRGTVEMEFDLPDGV